MERRRAPRICVKRSVFITEGRLGSGGTMLNLSEGGGAVECGRSASPDERLALHLVIYEDEPPLFIEEARVCWATEERFGVEFLAMSPEGRDRLHEFLRLRLEAGITAELRRYPRFTIRLPVAFWAERLNGLGETANLSKGGCAVESEVVPSRGLPLQLFMTVPTRDSSVVVDSVPVRWSRGRQFGVEFTALRPEAQQVLQQLIAGLAAGQGGL